MSNDFQSGSRSTYRAKRKKTNLILNSLIVIVLALIFFVAYTIFLSGDDQASTKKVDPKTEEKQSQNKEDTKEPAQETKETQTETETDTNTDEDSEEAAAPSQPDESKAVVTEGDGSSNVIRTIENPTWEPVGTVQTGEHVTMFDDTSIDWQEMRNAMAYATGLDESGMTVYWLSSDKTTQNASIGTVYSKETQEKYRVFIKWVDGEGWMPTKVEELRELEK